jgi:SAM-dependent methyltransferase
MDIQRKADLIKAYNLHAKEREKFEIEAWKRDERDHFLALLNIEGKQILLEIGTGHGRDSLFFQEHGLSVTGIDISPVMVDLCRQKGVVAFVMDIVDLEFELSSFDAVYALNSFLHLSKQEFPVALKHVHKVMLPGGLFYLGMYGGVDFEGVWEDDSYTPKRFFSLYTSENLKKNLSSWFEIIYFHELDFGEEELNFQSFILRKPLDD